MYLPVTQTDDSSEYLLFAQAITSNTVDSLGGTVIFRTPGYPLLLALGDLMIGSIESNIFYLHITISFLACFISIWFLQPMVAPWITLGAFGWYSLFNAPFSMVILTEWTVGALIVAVLSLLASLLHRPTLKTFICLSLMVSFGILIKPPMLILALIPALGVLCLPKSCRYQGLFTLVITALLPLSWAQHNYSKYGVFSLSPRSAVVKLAQAGLLSDKSITCDGFCQTTQESAFVESFSTRRKIAKDFVLSDRAIERAYNYNYGLILELITDAGWSVKEAEEFIKGLQRNIVAGQEFVYYEFIFTEFFSQIFVLPTLYQIGFLILVGFLILSIREGSLFWKEPLVLSTAAATVVHLVHMAACVSVVHMIPRFFLLTFLPLVYMVILCLVFSYTKKGSLSAAL